MSVRDLSENRSGEGDPNVETIMNVAETKGLQDDIEEIDRRDGDEVTLYYVFTDVVRNDDGSINDTDSVGTYVQDFDDSPVNTFRDNVQTSLTKLKRHLQDQRGETDDEPDELEQAVEADADADQDDTVSAESISIPSSVDPDAPPNSDATNTPGGALDATLADHDARISELEQRLDDLEDTIQLLEQLKELTND